MCVGETNVVQTVAAKPGIDASASTSSVVQQGRPTADIDQEVNSGKPVAPISATTSSTGESATAVANMRFFFFSLRLHAKTPPRRVCRRFIVFRCGLSANVVHSKVAMHTKRVSLIDIRYAGESATAQLSE